MFSDGYSMRHVPGFGIIIEGQIETIDRLLHLVIIQRGRLCAAQPKQEGCGLGVFRW